MTQLRDHSASWMLATSSEVRVGGLWKTTVNLNRTVGRGVLLLLLIGCTSFHESSSNDETTGPGHYAAWRASDGDLCRAVTAFVNRLPNQDVSTASNSEAPGFLRWAGVPTYVLTRDKMPKIVLPITNASLVLEQKAPPSWILRYSASIGGIADDVLYILPVGAPLPASAQEMTALLKSREPVFATFIHNKSERLKRNHGAEWSDWLLPGRAAVSGIEVNGRTLFLAESPAGGSLRPSKILVFSLSPERTQDVCMLRRF